MFEYYCLIVIKGCEKLPLSVGGRERGLGLPAAFSTDQKLINSNLELRVWFQTTATKYPAPWTKESKGRSETIPSSKLSNHFALRKSNSAATAPALKGNWAINRLGSPSLEGSQDGIIHKTLITVNVPLVLGPKILCEMYQLWDPGK